MWVKGFGERVPYKTPTYAEDLLQTPMIKAAESAFAMAGLTPQDMDMVSIYDCYTITALLSLEDAGFCEKGKGLQFVAEHDLTFRGDFPMNTAGGQLGYGQAGRPAACTTSATPPARSWAARAPPRWPTATARSSPATAESCPSRPLSCWKGTRPWACTKPMPIPTPTAKPFWDALAEHTIRIQYSPSRNRYVFYPRVLAPGHAGRRPGMARDQRGGTLYTYTVAHRPVAPHFADDVPQLLAVVEWDEGPRFSTEIVNARPEEVSVGMRVKPVFFDYPDDGVTMLRYEPA